MEFVAAHLGEGVVEVAAGLALSATAAGFPKEIPQTPPTAPSGMALAAGAAQPAIVVVVVGVESAEATAGLSLQRPPLVPSGMPWVAVEVPVDKPLVLVAAKSAAFKQDALFR